MIEANEQWLRHPISQIELDQLVKESYCRLVKRPGDKEPSECFSLTKRETGWVMSSSYFVGIDWLEEGKSAVRVKPKFDHEDNQIEINYLSMLEEALKEPKNFDQLDGLLYVDFNRPSIPVPRQDDMLSLFLVSEFLHVIKRITDKGLRKSYYLVEANQSSKIKGKILIPQNIKKNNIRGNYSDNYCRYQEFGVDIPENRLLKKAVVISSHLLDIYHSDVVKQLKQTISDVFPKWKNVKSECDPNKIREGKVNPFFKEYTIAIRLAKLILRKTAFNQVLHEANMTSTPPYWIDMSKLFEMYVLSKLRDRFGNDVIYHPHFRGQEPDYLLNGSDGHLPYIIDAKYKRYGEHSIETDDIRQVSGYGRMKSVRKALNVTDHSLIPCLIIYPEHESNDFIPPSDKWIDEGRYLDVYKLGVTLPII
jgi:5-methylcytosine-specific restriction enzyme subunit McrC